RDFLKHLHFLKETGYVDHNDKLTRDGLWASQLRVDQPLMIAEGFRKGSFPESDPALFAAIISLFVNEDESDYRIDREQFPSTLSQTIQQVGKELEPFAKRMTSRGFAVRALLPRPAIAIFSWATGQPWEKVLSTVDFAEGNLAMLILRTADNLRHIRSLQQVFPEAAETAAVAIDLLLRDPVVVP
ncbi:MAG: ATP-dependent DNA helicase, partial [Desulfobacterales bacterium]